MNMFVGSAAAIANSIPFAANAKDLMPPRIAPDGSDASPELRAAGIELADANDRLKETNEDFLRVWNLNGKWEREHPRPGSPRAHKKWLRRWHAYAASIGYDAAFDAHTEAREAFERAQDKVALLKARDMQELALKGCMSFVYEDIRQSHLRHVRPHIGQSVALELAFMSCRAAA